jgi:hypothetical protein
MAAVCFPRCANDHHDDSIQRFDIPGAVQAFHHHRKSLQIGDLGLPELIAGIFPAYRNISLAKFTLGLHVEQSKLGGQNETSWIESCVPGNKVCRLTCALILVNLFISLLP